MIVGFSILILLLRKAILLLIILKENLSVKVDDILNNSDKNKIPTTQEKPDSNHLVERSYIPMEGLLIILICFYLYRYFSW